MSGESPGQDEACRVAISANEGEPKRKPRIGLRVLGWQFGPSYGFHGNSLLRLESTLELQTAA
jgi:hypothetical protein